VHTLKYTIAKRPTLAELKSWEVIGAFKKDRAAMESVQGGDRAIDNAPKKHWLGWAGPGKAWERFEFLMFLINTKTRSEAVLVSLRAVPIDWRSRDRAGDHIFIATMTQWAIVFLLPQ